ncbi:hypothetical protein DM01DRAFT_1340277 [Hesseltinella vesiculosa]|uniref:Uncharacterized protein n=1 Tax=Hesseltinella vesiculosa TaxID=101127 RepID=A0A1X2G4G5_9FUNG|nr:hypothetical protein DM01DRAFT_1340277 [Hesseltinella vesiculosa]
MPMVEESSKKFSVGDMSPSPTTSANLVKANHTHLQQQQQPYKKPVRHHVKRRSSGRVHVTKLAPMARAHALETALDDPTEPTPQRKPMKRSHSSKSLHRLSTHTTSKGNLSGFAMTTQPTSAVKQQVSPPASPTHHTTPLEVTTPNNNKPKPTASNPAFHVSHQSPAAPIAHRLNATANTPVSMDSPAADIAQSTLDLSPPASSHQAQPPLTQQQPSPLQKLQHQQQQYHHQLLQQQWLQQQQLQHQQRLPLSDPSQAIPQHAQPSEFAEAEPEEDDDPDQSHVDPWMDALDKEYQDIRHHHHPMYNSMARCMQRKEMAAQASTAHLQHRLAQLSLSPHQQRTNSSSILPTLGSLPANSSTPVHRSASQSRVSSSPSNPIAGSRKTPCKSKLERLRAHATTHPSATASTSSIPSSNSGVPYSRWTYSGILDRMFFYATG